MQIGKDQSKQSSIRSKDMGHTSGLGNGFAMVAFIFLAIIAAIAGVGFGLAGIFGGGTPAFIVLGAVGGITGAYFCYQPRSVSLLIGIASGVGGWVASAVFASMGGFFGGLLGALAGAVVTFVIIVVCLMTMGSLFKGDSWRKKRV